MGHSTTHVLDTAAGTSAAPRKISLNRGNEDPMSLEWIDSPSKQAGLALTPWVESSGFAVTQIEIKLMSPVQALPTLGIQSHWLWECSSTQA